MIVASLNISLHCKCSITSRNKAAPCVAHGGTYLVLDALHEACSGPSAV